MKKIFVFISMLLILLSISSCKKDEKTSSSVSTTISTTTEAKVELLDKGISHETKFGGIYILITIEDFNKLGFKFGDSLDITFTNGYKLLDLPYYNGYYTNTGEALLVGYPGYPYIKACINNGEDLYTKAEVNDSDKASIKIHQKEKYLDIQEALDIHYTDIQGDIPDYKFGNYRVVNVGNLKENILYRSASPIDNQHNRAGVVDRLITNKVNTILDLSDTNLEIDEHIEKSDFNSPYFKGLYDKGNVIALSMNMNFKLGSTEEDEAPTLFTEFKEGTFQSKLISGLRFALNHDGPYLIHCVEGKDRTGFVSMVFEALGGASYNEIIDDYMITYDNYYDIKNETNLSKYTILKEKNIDEMLRTIINDDSVDIKTADYSYYIERYLISKGMEETEVKSLKTKLTR